MDPGKAYEITFLPAGARTKRVTRRVHLLEITKDGIGIFSGRPWNEGGTSQMSLSRIEEHREIPLPNRW